MCQVPGQALGIQYLLSEGVILCTFSNWWTQLENLRVFYQVKNILTVAWTTGQIPLPSLKVSGKILQDSPGF